MQQDHTFCGWLHYVPKGCWISAKFGKRPTTETGTGKDKLPSYIIFIKILCIPPKRWKLALGRFFREQNHFFESSTKIVLLLLNLFIRILITRACDNLSHQLRELHGTPNEVLELRGRVCMLEEKVDALQTEFARFKKKIINHLSHQG